MRSHAKASSAGSSIHRAEGQGGSIRGAIATRGTSSDADGSGAPSRRGRLLALSLAAALLALALFASSAFASKELISSFGSASGSGGFGGDFNNPRDIAVNGTGVGPADSGDVYVADEANNRIERFASNGNFISTWGKDVIAPSINERQRMVVKATAGTFTLSFDGSTTAPIPFNFAFFVESELAALPTVGSGNVSVSGEGTAINPFIITFTGALGGANQPTVTADTSDLTGTITLSTIVHGKSTVANDTGTGFEICTVATECKAGDASGGDGTSAGNGTLATPQSVAVDQDTGNVYVSDRENRRIDEYDGAGNFIRSFGFDVAESGPGDTGTGYEVCNEAEGDVCKAGEGGSGTGQYGEGFTENGFGIAVSPSDGNTSTGSVFLANTGNQRVETYNLDGTSPANFGSAAVFGSEQPRSIAVDSRGIVYASDSNQGGVVQRYDSQNANGGGVGFLAPILAPSNEVQQITFTGFAVGDKYTLTCPNGTPTEELTYSASANGLTIIKNGLEAACGASNFSFSGNPPNTEVTFQGTLGGANQPPMTCTKLTGPGSCSVNTTSDGNAGPLLPGSTLGLAVDPDSDGGGSDVDVLYVLHSSGSVQQFGSTASPPGQAPGLTAAPTAVDDTHGRAFTLSSTQGFGIDDVAGRLFLAATGDPDFFGESFTSAHRVYVLADSSSLPNPIASLPFSGAVTAIGDRSATFHGAVDPKGGYVSCKFQYSTDEISWTDAGGAEGTGDVSGGTITNVTTTSGAFVVGQLINGARIVAVNGKTLTLSFGIGNGTNVLLRATPAFPPRCDSLNLNSGEQNVSQEVAGLVPGQKYFVRLQVTRPYFSSFTPVTSGGVATFTTASGPPALAGASASMVDEHSVRVSATIDPANSPTAYAVQYGTTPALGSSAAPVNIGSGSKPIEVSSVITGLSPATQYYFKLVATNLVGSTASEGLALTTFSSPPSFGSCPNDLLRTGPSAKLPHCRAYEQVTPTDKYGSDAYGSPNSVEASSSGDGITFYTFAGFPGGEGFQEFNVLLSRFADGDWSTAGLSTPPSYGEAVRVLAWTSDVALSFVRARFSALPGGHSLVMRDSAGGSRTIVIPQGSGFETFILGGAFDGNSKVVFQASGAVPVTSGPAPISTARNVYLYDRDTGERTLAGLLPDSACGSPPCVPAGGSVLPAAFENFVRDGHAVSSSGNVYFTDFSSKQLYLRHEAADPGATTVQVSASERTNPDPAGTFEPTFMGATPDGGHAFFKSEEELTDNAGTAPGTEDLYRFDASAPVGQRLTDLAPGAQAVGVLDYSDSGSRVYLAANADLDGAGPAASGNCAGKANGVGIFNSFVGTCSVYLWQADGTGTCATAGGCISFVARLDLSGVLAPGESADVYGGSDGYNWAGSSSGQPENLKASRVSADGRILIFRSQRPLTTYDNRPTSEGVCRGTEGRCQQFYRYDAESGEISCLTCDPTGAPPTGAPELKNPDMFHVSSSHTVYSAQPFISRNLSPDGNRFFFQTPQKLVSADVNGEQACPEGPDPETGAAGDNPACTDVYMWEAPGTPGGSCTQGGTAYSPANDGCIYLLSTGTGAYPSYLADVSESGDAAFIFSRQQLVPSDEDTQEDIYAVKVNGGLAYQHATRPAACEGDACRGAASKPSDAPGAGTAVFEGPGNPKSGTDTTRCPKGKRQVRSKGKTRCVAKQRGSKKQKRDRKRAANNNRRANR